MTSETEINHRLDALETHIAHQDGTVEDLGGVVIKQWRTIEEMAARIDRLEAQLHALEDAVDRPAGEDPPPPHY